MLAQGSVNRRVGSHELNMESSRSHSMLTVHCNAMPTDPTAFDYGTVRLGKVMPAAVQTDAKSLSRP